MLFVNEREEGVVALHLSTGPLKNKILGCNQYQVVNPLPRSLVGLVQWMSVLYIISKTKL